MADRELKMPAKKINKDAEEEEIGRVPSQRQRPESGRYLLQVDRQTKSLANAGELKKHVYGKEDHLVNRKHKIWKTRGTLRSS